MLYPSADRDINRETFEPPGFFADLNLDQIIDKVTLGKEEYNLKPIFYTALHSIDAIRFRQEIMRDLDEPVVLECVKSFAAKMRSVRNHLAQAKKSYYQFQERAFFLDAAEIYCDAIQFLANTLFSVHLCSQGFLSFRQYMAEYNDSQSFRALLSETKEIKSELSSVRYCLFIKGNSITVRKYESEADYSSEVEKTFERFKQGAVKDYRAEFSDWIEMNHIEAQILDYVAKLYPTTFSRLNKFRSTFKNFMDEKVMIFDREIQFYVAYLDYVSVVRGPALKFCYPVISEADKEVRASETYDLALAYKLVTSNQSVVCNNFYLDNKEHVLVVTGPNQGGKTTFARMFGQLYFLGSLGCLVPGQGVQLTIFDQIYTHFEREEHVTNLNGKLQDDLIRIHGILGNCSSRSIVIMNEIFSSTTLQDAAFLGKMVMQRIIELGSICVIVTFIDELASFGQEVVSLVSEVVPGNPALRTYKVLRKPADGIAYAKSIAEKYGLTYARLRERIEP